MKRNIIFKLLLLSVTMILLAAPAEAQRRARTNVAEISGVVADENGIPLTGVAVTGGEGAITVYTDPQGRYQLKAKTSSAIVFEAEGYQTRIIYMIDEPVPAQLHMVKTGLFASENDIVNRADGEQMLRRDEVGATSSLDIEKMKRYPDLSLTNAMQGMAPGLIVRAQNGGLGNNAAEIFIRGQHGLGGNTAIIVVDGVVRSVDDILAEEIESIEILKDATAKVLYGASAANGVVLVTTKRGAEGRKVIRTSVEYGVMVNTRTPEFLGAVDYVNLYNEARANDGLAPKYSAAQIEGYRNSKGVNDALYPDVDWYGQFLRNHSTFTKATLEFNGGNSVAKYALVAGYMGGKGLETIGKRTATDQLNLRGNLDIKLNRFITVKADVAGRIYMRHRANRSATEIMDAISTTKPNEYAFVLSPELLGLAEPEDGIPYFGGSIRRNNNLYADLAYSGDTQDRSMRSQANLGIDLNLGSVLKGLSAEAFVTFDNYNFLAQKLEKIYSTYSVVQYFDADGNETIQSTRLKQPNINSNQQITDNQTLNVIGARGNISYTNTFGEHSLGAVLGVRFSTQQFKGVTQDHKNLSYTLRLNYDYGKRYLAEVAVAYMGSNAYTGGQQYMFAPTAGLAWILSNEEFMKEARWVDFLKVKASAGLLGYDGNAVFQSYSKKWQENGTRWESGENNSTTLYPMNIVTVGNPNLKWETSTELNVGFEAAFLSQRLRAEANWFTAKRRDIMRINAGYTSALGDYTWYDNTADVTNRGVEAFLSWGDRHVSGFSYRVGANFTYTKSRIDRIDQEDGREPWRSRIGKSVGAVITYADAGLFGKNVDLATHPFQTFGPVQAGDIAYVDYNSDNVIDGRDRHVIGSTFPTTVWGVDADFNYKGFGLYLLGTAETNVIKQITTYYRNGGEDSYSIKALDRFHPVNNPGGTMPRLSTSSGGDNNSIESGYWYKSAGFFRLKNVELSYTFQDRIDKTFFSTLKIFVRGTNLLLLSPLKDLDPERPTAGFNSYPTYMGITGGVSITF